MRPIIRPPAAGKPAGGSARPPERLNVVQLGGLISMPISEDFMGKSTFTQCLSKFAGLFLEVMIGIPPWTSFSVFFDTFPISSYGV